MEDPTDSVVDHLGLGEGLVTTFVGDDPETGSEETSEESVKCPDREFGEGVEMGVW